MQAPRQAPQAVQRGMSRLNPPLPSAARPRRAWTPPAAAMARTGPGMTAPRTAGVAPPGTAAPLPLWRAPLPLPARRRRITVPAAAAGPPSAVPVAAPVPDAPAAAIALPLPRAVESAADDPLLHNPLQRLERLSTSWFGVITNLDGIIVDSTLEVHKAAWRQVAAEMNLPMPLGSAMARIGGLRDDAVVMQLFCWTRNPQAAARIAARKEEVYDSMMNGAAPAEAPGMRAFLETLRKNRVPIAVASPLPERRVRPALERLGLSRAFDAVISAEDAGPTAELESTYLAASHALGRPPLRCVVIADDHRSVEAAREAGMKAVAIAGGAGGGGAAAPPAWSFGGADLVVRGLSQLSFVNLKNLFGQEDLVEPSVPWDEIQKSRREAEESSSSAGYTPGYTSSGDDTGYAFGLGAESRSTSSSTGGGGFSWGAANRSAQQSGSRFRRFDSGGDDDAVSALSAMTAWTAAGGAGPWSEDMMGSGEERQQQQQEEEGMFEEEEEEEDFEVILPPPGAGVWDLRR